ncbi:MAG: hypothetical protein JWO30_572 [Fibrobacteres bacterium]|nr:hypothetical protein [Fibrobacterota bacterium]
MSTRIPKILFAAAGLAFSLFLGSCQTTDPPPAETVLWVKLNDSLSRYDLVVVQILDRQTKEVVATLWNARLPAPNKDIPGYSLRSLASQPFIVKVSGYLGRQLALETVITYEGGGIKHVLHTDLPPVQPVNGLLKMTPSIGSMSPLFVKDTLNYKVTVPAGITALSFNVVAENPAAAISFDGKPVASGASSQPIAIGNTPDTIEVKVTDMSTGTAATRTYTLVLFPTLPPGLNLTSIRPSAGTLFPEFTPQAQVYTLTLPPGVDTVSFFLTPSDPQTMTMKIKDIAIFTGAKSTVYKIDASSTLAIPIEVFRGDEASFYQVTITH